jgi:dihydrofolate reductase
MIAQIVAISKNNVIGKDNRLPWHYKKDLQYFKETTLHHTVLMGRKTYESILSTLGKPLPKRHNIVASKTVKELNGVKVISNIREYVESFPKDETLFIIGGKQIFDETIDLVDYLYITHIDQTYEGDTFFSSYNPSDFTKIKETVDGELHFTVYKRVRR